MELGDAIDRAIKGDRRALFDILARGSKLPGTRANDALASAFADIVATRDKGLRLALEMAALHADEAPGDTALEFLPVCGVYALGAIGARAKDEKARTRAVAALHDAAEDLRFRVRDAVPLALEAIGAAHGPWLARALAGWMDGFFHAAAALRALARPNFLNALAEADEPVARLDEAWTLVAEAPRSMVRYPGHKALMEELAKVAAPFALRFGAPVFDALEARARSLKDPVLRDALERCVREGKLGARFASDVARVRAALSETAPPVRDPRAAPRPTRRRGRR